MIGSLRRSKKKNGRSAVNKNKLTCTICHGFNNHFDVPRVGGKKTATHRTAVVIKKCDFYDEWDLYDDLFWRMVPVIAAEIADSYRIKVMDRAAPVFDTVLDLRKWQAQQKESDSEFILEPPGEIDLLFEGNQICHIGFEDWSDIVKYEPYASSFTFSFYSANEDVDAKIADALHKFLSSEKGISKISVVDESPSPKWYWPLLSVIKGDTFLICSGFSVLALFGIIMIVISPTPSTCNKVEQSRRFLKKVRTVLLAADEKVMDKPFIEWRVTQGIASTNDSLAVQICRYCKEYLRLSGRKPLRTREIDGPELLIDPWGNPYNAEMLDNLRNDKIRRAFARLNADGIVMWSSGPNGINEEGEGDDIFELPQKLWNGDGGPSWTFGEARMSQTEQPPRGDK